MLATIKQLLSEFLLPLVGALLWSAYNLHELPHDQWSLKVFINIFGPTFFIVSWLISQFFRVRKQQKVEGGLLSIETNVKRTLTDLEEKTTDLVGYITGGGSACYLIGAPLANNVFHQPMLVHVGKHPIYEVHARIVHLEAFEKIKDNLTRESIRSVEIHGSFGNLIPGHCVDTQLSIPLGEGEICSFNIFYTARNGAFIQMLRFRKVNGSWSYATKVMRGDNVLHEQVLENFPRDANGKIIW